MKEAPPAPPATSRAALHDGPLLRADRAVVDVCRSAYAVEYRQAMECMERRARDIIHKRARECIWLLEHTPLVTAGTGAAPGDLRHPDRFPVYSAGRGGKLTYHGPGQRIGYVMLDLGMRGRDVRRFVAALEAWIIGALAELGVRGERREARVGIWVMPGRIRAHQGAACSGAAHEDSPAMRESKIAAIGIRLRKWVSLYGVSVNIRPDLSHYETIVPCGIADYPVTSLERLGIACDMARFDEALLASARTIFGPVALREGMP